MYAHFVLFQGTFYERRNTFGNSEHFDYRSRIYHREKGRKRKVYFPNIIACQKFVHRFTIPTPKKELIL